MALIKCDECGHDVSTKATSCANCGAPVVHSTDSVGVSTESNGLKSSPPSKTGAITYIARAYFISGAVLAMVLYPWFEPFVIGKLVGKWLMLGLGIALLAFGYSRRRHDRTRSSVIVVGWIYTAVILLGIFGAMMSGA